jgi:hypothetical protein
MVTNKLDQIVVAHPFPDYSAWWNVGDEFLGFMSDAIVLQWAELHGNDGRMDKVNSYVTRYVELVYHRSSRASLVADFVTKRFSPPIQSGEFDALSYAFYRSAFELIESYSEAYQHQIARERRTFSKRVGKIFFAKVNNHLQLDLPTSLSNEQDFVKLKDNIRRVGIFLAKQRYLRDHFDFRFTLDEEYAGNRILQTESDFVSNLKQNGIAYALYEMGYPIILPSAVYLYHTIGEAQHHSSRTIEELFDRIGYQARETDDFDPTNYPSDRVIELWEIKKLG